MTAEEKAANKALYAEQRRKYLDKELTHQEFYLWLSDWLGLHDSLIPATPEEVLASKDPHLNDIPLGRWDRMDASVRQYVGKLGFWSLSDTVCCLKAMANRRAERS